MGTLSYYRAPGQSDLDHFRSRFEGLNILDGASKNGAFYAAAEQVMNGKPVVFALVVKFHRSKQGSDGTNFSYKEMDETVGPYYTDCPARILDQLSPLEELVDPSSSSYENASEWRRACRETIDAEASRVKVARGDTIKFATPYNFNDNSSEDTFTLLNGRRNQFRGLNGRVYRLRNSWRQAAYTVLTDEERKGQLQRRADKLFKPGSFGATSEHTRLPL